MSYQPRFYATPNFLKMGLNYLNCRLLDNFDNKGRKVCCKVSLYKNCQRQSCSAINCLSSGINILVGVALFPWYLNVKGPTPIGSTCVVHTLSHSLAAVTSLRH